MVYQIHIATVGKFSSPLPDRLRFDDNLARVCNPKLTLSILIVRILRGGVTEIVPPYKPRVLSLLPPLKPPSIFTSISRGPHFTNGKPRKVRFEFYGI